MEFGIALGSNLGDRLQNMRDAVDAMRSHLIPGSAVERSPIYASDPVDCPKHAGRFYNAVIVVQFDGAAKKLLTITQSIETAAGRAPLENREVNAPRAIDLDLLYAGSEQIDSEALVVPHPRLHLRRFVLEPLASVRPQLILPGREQSIDALLEALQSDEAPLDCVTADW